MGDRDAPVAPRPGDGLHYALDVVRLRIAPLRERRADIPLLYAHFLAEASDRAGRKAPALTDRTRRHLLEHDWPGNVRELRSFAFAEMADVRDAAGAADDDDAALTLPMRVDRFEASAIRAALEETGGNAARAIAMLGLPRKTFYDKLTRHGLAIADFRR